MSLIERAEREYQLLMHEGYGKSRTPKVPGTAGFDFMTTVEDTPPVPIHRVEIAREDTRRHFRVDRDTSKQDFAASLGIELDDTRDPVTGRSVLELSEALRSYLGDPEEAAYRTFKRHLLRVSTDMTFFKESQFLGDGIKRQYDQMQFAARHLAQLEAAFAANTAADRANVNRLIVDSHYGHAHKEALHQFRDRRADGC